MPDTLPVRKTRSRANTIDLVVPTPLASPNEYDQKCLEERAEYAAIRLNSATRKPTPLTAKALEVYLQACLTMSSDYSHLTEEQRVRRATEIREYDDDLSRREWLRENPSSGLLADVLALRKMAYWARYGDYAGHIASHLRIKAAKDKTEFWTELSGEHLWTDISAKLKAEAPDYKANGNQHPEQTPTTWAVYKACLTNAISFNPMINIIHLYADRNEAFHRGLKEMLEAERYWDIAQCIFDDLENLASVCPPDAYEEEETMRLLLETLRDDWFDTSFGPNNVQKWQVKPSLRDYMKDMKDALQRMSDHAVHLATKIQARMDHDQEDLALVKQAIKPPQSNQLPEDGPKTPVKMRNWKPVPQKARKPPKVNDRQQSWKTILDTQYKIHKDVQAATNKQRELNRLVREYRKHHGDAPPP